MLKLSELLFISEVARWKKEGWVKPDDVRKLKFYMGQVAGNGVPLYYVHFSELPKVGINPEPDFGFTPHGIYTYPIIPETISSIRSGKIFGTKRPYMMIVRPKNPERILISSTYSSDDLFADIGKLLEKYEGGQADIDYILQGITTGNKVDKFIKAVGMSEAMPIKNLLFITKAMSPVGKIEKRYQKKQSMVDADTMEWRRKLTSLGYEGIVDLGHSIITADISSQAVFFSKQFIEDVEMIYNVNSKTDPLNLYHKHEFIDKQLNKLSIRNDDEKNALSLFSSAMKRRNELSVEEKEEILANKDLTINFKNTLVGSDPIFYSGMDMKIILPNTVINKQSLDDSEFIDGYNNLINFIRSDFTKSVLRNFRFIDCDFEYCKFSDMEIDNIEFLSNTTFTGCNFRGAQFKDCNIPYIGGSYLVDCNFNQCDFEWLKNCNLTGATFDSKTSFGLLTGCIRDPLDIPIPGYHTDENGLLVKN